MVDVVGLAMASSAALEQTIKIFTRIRNAKNRQKDVAHMLGQHEAIIKGTASLVSAVIVEDELSTGAILAVIDNVKTTSEELRSLVKGLSDKVGRGAVRDFTHQLFKGSDDEKELTKLVALLTSHKADLAGAVTAAQVGLMKGVNGTRVVDARQVRDVDQRLQEETDGMERLKIAEVLEGVEPDENGNITLSGEQVIALARTGYKASEGPIELEEDEKAAYASDKTVRIVKLNRAKKNALQMNAPIGTDMWADKDIVIVKGNVADEGAVQANVPIEDPNTFLEAVRIRYQAGLVP